MRSRPLTILTFVGHYLPSYKSGGPVRSVSNLVDNLGDEFRFRIVTRDRDWLDKAPFDDVVSNEWTKVGKAEVFYASPKALQFRAMERLMRTTDFDIVYLNSFFEPKSTLLPLLLRRIKGVPSAPIILAPRGEFSPGALAIKAYKKRAFISLSTRIGLYDGITFQASTEHEADDIHRALGRTVDTIVAGCVPAKVAATPVSAQAVQDCGPLRVVFLSRVTRKKNLEFALRTLLKVRIPVVLDIIGPIGDEHYWKSCQRIILASPANVTVNYLGYVEPGKVVGVMMGYDLLFLPTFGENYGHAIAESLSAGTPVLLSDATPWRGLDSLNWGWDLPLNVGVTGFAERIEHVGNMTPAARRKWREGIVRSFTRRSSTSGIVEANRLMFLKVSG